MTSLNLTSLPQEIIVKIFSNLESIKDVRSILSASNHFRNIYLTSKTLMKDKKFRLSGYMRNKEEIEMRMNFLRNSGHLINSLAVENFRFNNENEFFEILKWIPNVEFLEFVECYVHEIKEYVDSDPESAVEDDEISYSPNKKIRKIEETDTLFSKRFKSNYQKNLKFYLPYLEELSLEKLKKLSIVKLGFDPKHFIRPAQLIESENFYFYVRELTLNNEGKLSFGGKICYNRTFYEFLKFISTSVKRVIHKGYKIDSLYVNLFIRTFTNLEELRMYQSQDINDFDLKTLEKYQLKNMKILITDHKCVKSIQTFAKIFPNLEYLRLSEQLKNESFQFLSNLKKLKVVRFFTKVSKSRKQNRWLHSDPECDCNNYQMNAKTILFNGYKEDVLNSCEMGCTVDSDNETFDLHSDSSDDECGEFF